VYSDDVEKIKNTLAEIEKRIDVHKYIKDIHYSEEDNFMMNIDFFHEQGEEECDGVDELLARWTLGKQIVHYFERTKNEKCVFWGEN
jgi:hypothetical protein